MSSKPPVWKKPKSKVYDYNYNFGEHYYKPQLRHMDNKYTNRGASPPRAKTFAERFAEDPVYGNNSTEYGYRTTADRPMPFESVRSTPPPPLPRRTSLQDEFGSSLGSRRQPLFESSRGFSPDRDDEFLAPRRPRLNFGERLLEAVGTPRTAGISDNLGFGRGLSPAVQDDPFEDSFFQRRKLQPPRSADADFLTEDPFKSRRNNEALFRSALNDEDEGLSFNDFKRDSESQVAGFRSRMQARRARAEEEANASEFDSAAESRVDRIRSRAKARLAELEGDLPNLSLNTRSSSLSRDRRERDLDSSAFSSNVGATKTLRITKRTVKTSIDTD